MSEEENRPTCAPDDRRTKEIAGMPEQTREQFFGAELSAVHAAANSVASNARSNVATFKSRADQTDFDVIIVGAGLSGIGVAYHLQRDCPRRSFVILEARGAIGGTWDLFRYPGIRSDSDMHTLGYRFRPWRGKKAIADGPSILDYLNNTAREYGIDRKIRYHHKVKRASWSSTEARWTLEVPGPGGKTLTYTCNFLQMCSGYYDYDAGYMPGWVGLECFKGEIVHPQKWPEDLGYAGKRVVVIGSGAKPAKLGPAVAGRAAHVTMLQRSPSYIVSLPAEDPIAKLLRRVVGTRIAYPIVRWKNVLLTMLSFQLSRRRPQLVKAMVRRGVEKRLPARYDVPTHFQHR